MISYIRGELAYIEEDKVVVDVAGVGYAIFMPGSSIGLLPPIGEEVKIHTYLNVKEDCMQLFGFLTRDDLEVFRLVIGVNGIGPKGGLNILSQLTPDGLRFAVLSGEVKAISAAPGIGQKTAEKLILELSHSEGKEKEKFALQSPQGNIQGEAVQALVALGYGNTESLRAVKQVAITEDTQVEEVLKQALKLMVF